MVGDRKGTARPGVQLLEPELFAHAQQQSSPAQKVAAEALFDDALKLMRAGKHADACPKLEESQRLDPGIGTLLYLGECYENVGRTASAWASFREAASRAGAEGQSERLKSATERASRLEPKLAYLTIQAAPEARAIQGLSVRLGQTVIGAELFSATSLEDRMAALWRNISRPVAGGGNWIALEHELWSYAMRNDEARARLAARYRSAWAGVDEAARGWTGGDGAVGAALLGMLLGLEMMRRLDPTAVTDEGTVSAAARGGAQNTWASTRTATPWSKATTL